MYGKLNYLASLATTQLIVQKIAAFATVKKFITNQLKYHFIKGN
jgi:hypothetical protein